MESPNAAERKILKEWTFVNPKSGEKVKVSAYREKTTSYFGTPSIEYGWTEEWPNDVKQVIEDIAISHPGGVRAFIEKKFQDWEVVK